MANKWCCTLIILHVLLYSSHYTRDNVWKFRNYYGFDKQNVLLVFDNYWTNYYAMNIAPNWKFSQINCISKKIEENSMCNKKCYSSTRKLPWRNFCSLLEDTSLSTKFWIPFGISDAQQILFRAPFQGICEITIWYISNLCKANTIGNRCDIHAMSAIRSLDSHGHVEGSRHDICNHDRWSLLAWYDVE